MSSDTASDTPSDILVPGVEGLTCRPRGEAPASDIFGHPPRARFSPGILDVGMRSTDQTVAVAAGVATAEVGGS